MDKDIREIRKEELENESTPNESIPKKFVRYTKDGAKMFWEKGKYYGKKAYDNKEKIVAGITGIAGSVVLIRKAADSIGLTSHKTQYERTVEARKTQYYDPSSRRYFDLKREPRQCELIEIEERRQNGEPVILILSDMGLLERRW